MNDNEKTTTAPTRRFATSAETATALVFFVALWLFWGVRYGDFLFVAQENSIFLFRAEFFTRWQQVPGGLLFYLTAFLIQFFYFPFWGGLILAVLGSGLQLTTAKLLKLRGPASVLSFLPTCCLTVATTWNAYEIYIPFNGTQPIAPFLGFLTSLGVLAVFQTISSARRRSVFAVAAGFLGYPGFGFWALFATFLCGLDEATDAWTASRNVAKNRNSMGKNSRKAAFDRAVWTRLAFLLGTAVLAPIIWRFFVFYARTTMENAFLQGLIEDIREEKKFPISTVVYGTTILTPVLWSVLVVVAKLRQGTESERLSRQAERERERREKREKLEREKREAARRAATPTTPNVRRVSSRKTSSEGAGQISPAPIVASAADVRNAAKRRAVALWELAFVVWAAAFGATYRTGAFFSVLASSRATEAGDWERILELDARLPKPIEQNVAFRNLALFETGLLAEKAFERPIAGAAASRILPQDVENAKRGNAFALWLARLDKMRKETERSAPRAIPERIFCHYGATNVAARIATDNLVASESRAVSFHKTLAICALVNGEERLARRYLNELTQTLFYRDWANARLAFLESPDFRKGVRDSWNDVEYGKIAKARADARPRAASVDEAARRYGVEAEEVLTVAERIAKAREMRPLVDANSYVAYPNATFFLGIVGDNYDDASPNAKILLLIGALYEKKADAFLANVEKYIAQHPDEPLPKALDEGYAIWSFAKYGADWEEKVTHRCRPETLDGLAPYLELLFAVRRNPGAPKAQEALRHVGEGRYWGYASDESVFGQ